MFSEYASRFLAQSQSRLSIGQPDPNPPSRSNPRDRSRGPPRYAPSRSYLQRTNMGNPYQPSGSQLGRFPFASRASVAPAPLFYSATDEFREEDDAEEHEREVADYYALAKSRKQFGAGNLSESSEVDDEAGLSSHGDEEGRGTGDENRHRYGVGRGIRSSWRGGKGSIMRGRKPDKELLEERQEREQSNGGSDSSGRTRSSKGKQRLVDVDLESTIRGSMEQVERPGSSAEVEDDTPPAYQSFRTPPRAQAPRIPQEHLWIPRETDEEEALVHPRPPSPDRESVPPGVGVETPEAPRHDAFWATLYWIALVSIFASSFLVWLHTDTPKKFPYDTIYNTLHKSFHLLAVDTLVAIIIALLWLAILRQFGRPLLYLLVAAVPIIMVSFALWPLISSYNGRWHGSSVQDKIMRTTSLVPTIGAILWTYLVWKGRHNLEKAAETLEFSCKILAASPALLLAGFATLFSIVAWTWIWILMFTRVFLEGHLSFKAGKNLFVIDGSTWWLGVFFILMYLWTLSVISGVQRATTAATVSQWYFHRYAVPAPSSRQVVLASFTHAIQTLFGTICLSTFLSLAVRLPLLLLPRRLAGMFSLCIYQLIPTPIATLTNPLTLTYAAIHSQPLSQSASALSQMSFVSKTSPTTTATPRSMRKQSGGGNVLQPYRFAKLLLHATRWIMTFALGFGGWISTARMLEVVDSSMKGTYRGSAYAYIVGLIAAAIGWGVLGSMEGVLGGILDALVVCWGSEVGAMGAGEVRYCREAGDLFGEREGGGFEYR